MKRNAATAVVVSLPPDVKGDIEGEVLVKIVEEPKWPLAAKKDGSAVPVLCVIKWWGQRGRGNFVRPGKRCVFPVRCPIAPLDAYLRDARELSIEVCNAKTLVSIGRSFVGLAGLTAAPIERWVPVSSIPGRVVAHLRVAVSFKSVSPVPRRQPPIPHPLPSPPPPPAAAVAEKSELPETKSPPQRPEPEVVPEKAPEVMKTPFPPDSLRPRAATDEQEAPPVTLKATPLFTPNPKIADDAAASSAMPPAYQIPDGRQSALKPESLFDHRSVSGPSESDVLREVLERGKKLLQDMSDPMRAVPIEQVPPPPPDTSAPQRPSTAGKLSEDDDESLLEELFFGPNATKKVTIETAGESATADEFEAELKRERVPASVAAKGKKLSAKTAAKIAEDAQKRAKEVIEEEEEATQQPALELEGKAGQCVVYVRLRKFLLRPRPVGPFQFEVKIIPGTNALTSSLFPAETKMMAPRTGFEGTVRADITGEKALEHFLRNFMVVELRCCEKVTAIVKVPLHTLHEAISRVTWNEAKDLPCIGFNGTAEVLLLPSLGPGGTIDVTVAAGTLPQVRNLREFTRSASILQRAARRFLARLHSQRRQESLRASHKARPEEEPAEPNRSDEKETPAEVPKVESPEPNARLDEGVIVSDQEDLGPGEGAKPQAAMIKHVFRVTVSSISVDAPLRKGWRIFHVSYTFPPEKRPFRTQAVELVGESAVLGTATKHTLFLPSGSNPVDEIGSCGGAVVELWRARSRGSAPERVPGSGAIPADVLRVLCTNWRESSASEMALDVEIGGRATVRFRISYSRAAVQASEIQLPSAVGESGRVAFQSSGVSSSVLRSPLAIHLTVVRASGLEAAVTSLLASNVRLRSAAEDGPCVFVRCSLLPGFSCMDTPVAAPSGSPSFKWRASLTATADEAVVEHIKSGVAVFDLFHQEMSASPADGTTSISLGKAEVPLRGLLIPPKEVHGWFNVVAPTGGGIVGALEVAMYLEELASADPEESSLGTQGGWIVTHKLRSTKMEESATSTTAPENRQPRPTVSTAETQTKPQTPRPAEPVTRLQPQRDQPHEGPRLSVGIIRALRLKNSSGEDSVESFIAIEALGASPGTPPSTPAAKGPSPFWGATILLPWKENFEKGNPLILRAWEGPSPTARAEAIGRSEIDLSVLGTGIGMREIHGWYAVVDEKGQTRGHVEVIVFPAEKGRQASGGMSASCRCPPTAPQIPKQPQDSVASLGVQDLSSRTSKPPAGLQSQSPSKAGGLGRVATTLLAAIDSQLQQDSVGPADLVGRLRQNLCELDLLNRALQERLNPPQQQPTQMSSKPVSEFELPPPPKPPAFLASMISKGSEPPRPAAAPSQPPERPREAEVSRRKVGGYSDPEVQRIARIMKATK